MLAGAGRAGAAAADSASPCGWNMRVLPIGASRNGEIEGLVPRTVVRRSTRGVSTALRGRNLSDGVEDAAVAAHAISILGSAVGVVEDDAGSRRQSQAPQIGDADGARTVATVG